MESLANEASRLLEDSPTAATTSVGSGSDSSVSSLECGTPPARAGRHTLKDLYRPNPTMDDSLPQKTSTPIADAPRVWSRIDTAAAQFAARMAFLLTVSGLFVVIRSDKWNWPDAMWVLISVLFVCWFPALDAASVIEKIVQRLIGTFIGAMLGLCCGFTSLLLFRDTKLQKVFVMICMFVFNFLIIFLAGQFKVGQVKVIRSYAYATILCVLTFCICVLPFGLDVHPKWELAVWRIVNVIVGCLLGALGSILVCPKSTIAVLHEKTARQVKLCGEASEAVLLMAADHFAGKVLINALADELIDAPLETTVRWKLPRLNSGNLSEQSSITSTPKQTADVALKKFEDAIADWNASKVLFPLTKYDPFRMGQRQQVGAKNAFNKEIARTLARSLRIQTTIVMLDGMIRHDTEYHFAPYELLLFTSIGRAISRLLYLPLDSEKSNQAAVSLFTDLEAVRHRIRELVRDVSSSENFMDLKRRNSLLKFQQAFFTDDGTDDDEVGRGIPKCVSEPRENTLFFFQLVEHLILRSLRLFQAWKHVEREAMKVNDESLKASLRRQRGGRISSSQPGDSLRSMILGP